MAMPSCKEFRAFQRALSPKLADAFISLLKQLHVFRIYQNVKAESSAQRLVTGQNLSVLLSLS